MMAARLAARAHSGRADRCGRNERLVTLASHTHELVAGGAERPPSERVAG
jgi:hypothetical protein